MEGGWLSDLVYLSQSGRPLKPVPPALSLFLRSSSLTFFILLKIEPPPPAAAPPPMLMPGREGIVKSILPRERRPPPTPAAPPAEGSDEFEPSVLEVEALAMEPKSELLPPSDGYSPAPPDSFCNSIFSSSSMFLRKLLIDTALKSLFCSSA